MICLLILLDTIQQCATNTSSCNSSFLSSACEIATVVIAIVNVILLIRTSNKVNKADVERHEQNRKLELFTTLVLDQSMTLFYKFFNDFSDESENLLTAETIEAKKEIDQKLQKQTRYFRQRFIKLLSAIDEQLYSEILCATDSLMDPITEAIFDQGINLTHKPKFDEKISKVISENQVKMIKILFNYRGQ